MLPQQRGLSVIIGNITAANFKQLRTYLCVGFRFSCAAVRVTNYFTAPRRAADKLDRTRLHSSVLSVDFLFSVVNRAAAVTKKS